MIDATHALPISRQAQLAGISRGSVYYVPTSVSAADLVLMRRLTSCTWSTRSWARVCCATN
jgi:putative transposase